MEGKFEISDETGQKVTAVPEYVFYFPKGAKITFTTDDYGLAFFVSVLRAVICDYLGSQRTINYEETTADQYCRRGAAGPGRAVGCDSSIDAADNHTNDVTEESILGDSVLRVGAVDARPPLFPLR